MRKYGFKVCYKEAGNRRYVRRFLAFTRKQAISMLGYYVRYPPKTDCNLTLKNPRWKIIPVSRKESEAGIWEEPPF